MTLPHQVYNCLLRHTHDIYMILMEICFHCTLLPLHYDYLLDTEFTLNLDLAYVPQAFCYNSTM